MFRRFAVVLSFLLTPFLTYSQEKVWGMQDCIQYALEHNIAVEQSRLDANVQQINLDESKFSQLPSLNASALHSYNFGRTVDPTTNRFVEQEIRSGNLSLSSNVTLFNGFSLRNQIKQNEYELLAGKENVERQKNDLMLNVAAAYLQVIYAKESVTLAEKRLASAKESRDRTRKLVDAGSMAMGSLYDEESAVATEELNMVDAENSLATAIIDLTQLMDLDYDPDFRVEAPKVDLPDQSAIALPTNDIYNVAMETLPVVRFSAYKVLGAESGLAAFKGNRYPRITMFGSLGSGYSSLAQDIITLVPFVTEKTSFEDQMKNNYNESFGFSLSIPIFNGRFTESNIQRSKIGLENARLNQELTHDQLYKDVVLAHANAKSSQKRYAAAEQSATAMSESFKYAEKRYDLGALSSIEFLKARDNRDIADSEFLQAKYELIFRIKALDFYLGRSLTF